MMTRLFKNSFEYNGLTKKARLIGFLTLMLGGLSVAQMQAQAQETESFFPLSPAYQETELETNPISEALQDPLVDIAPVAEDTNQTELLELTTKLDAKMTAIEEALSFINRRLESLPLGNALPLQQDQNQQELLQRLSEIESRLLDMAQNNNVNSGANSGALDQAGVADLRLRLGQIEEVMRTLNGQIEDVSFRLTKLGERFEQIAADTEFRFQELELATRKNASSYAQASADAQTTSEPQVLGTIKVQKTAPIHQAQEAEAAVLVGEARLVEDDPLGARTNEDVLPVQDPLSVYDEALQKLRMGAYEEAQEKLVYFLEYHKAHKLAGNAQYWLGETYYVRRDYKSAASAFLEGYTTFSKSQKAPDSLLKLGMTLMIMGEKETGCDAFAELSSKFPDANQSVIQRAEIERQRAGCV